MVVLAGQRTNANRTFWPPFTSQMNAFVSVVLSPECIDRVGTGSFLSLWQLFKEEKLLGGPSDVSETLNHFMHCPPEACRICISFLFCS